MAHIRIPVVIFLFDGRNSGQQRHEERERSEPGVGQLGSELGDADCACTFQIVPNDVQLLECCPESSTSSETAKMQDWPSNWIFSAE